MGQVRDYHYVDAATGNFYKDVDGGVNLAIGPVPRRGILKVVGLFKAAGSGAQAVDVRAFSRDPAESDVNNGGRFDLTRDLSGGKLTIPASASGEIEGSPDMAYELADDEFVASVLRYTVSGQPTDGDTFQFLGHTFTFKSSPVASRDVQIGADFDTTYASLVAKMLLMGFEETPAYAAGSNLLSFTSPTTWTYDTMVQWLAGAVDISGITSGIAAHSSGHITGKGSARFIYLKCDDPSATNNVGGTVTIEDRETP